MKKYFLPALLLATALNVGATGYKSILVTHTDGSTSQIILSGDLKTSFDETNVIFKDNDFLLEIEKINVVKFEFSTNSGVDNIEVNADNISLDSGILKLNGLPENSKVTVYTTSGVCLSNAICSGNFEVNLNEFAAGIYLVKINNVSYKIALSK